MKKIITIFVLALTLSAGFVALNAVTGSPTAQACEGDSC